MERPWATSGYLIEKTFARMSRESMASENPRTPDPWNRPEQYRGLQREPLLGWTEALRGSGVVEPTDQELQASLFLDELENAGKANWDIVFALEDAREVMRRIEPPVEWEIVWARCLDVENVGDPPAGTLLLGYEPGEFYPPTCYSPIANSLFFTVLDESKPRHEQQLRLKMYYEKLNNWGLFDTQAEAQEYLAAFFTLLPDERDYAYYMIEVRAIAD